jgi:hypothetical protein
MMEDFFRGVEDGWKISSVAWKMDGRFKEENKKATTINYL